MKVLKVNIRNMIEQYSFIYWVFQYEGKKYGRQYEIQELTPKFVKRLKNTLVRAIEGAGKKHGYPDKIIVCYRVYTMVARLDNNEEYFEYTREYNFKKLLEKGVNQKKIK